MHLKALKWQCELVCASAATGLREVVLLSFFYFPCFLSRMLAGSFGVVCGPACRGGSGDRRCPRLGVCWGSLVVCSCGALGARPLLRAFAPSLLSLPRSSLAPPLLPSFSHVCLLSLLSLYSSLSGTAAGIPEAIG